MRFREVNQEVFYIDEVIIRVDTDTVAMLRRRAIQNERKRMRICTHLDEQDRIHEMIIALADGIYIQPHKHPNKSESYHLIEGGIDIVIFDDTGEIIDLVELREPGSGKAFYYRISVPYFHTVIVRSGVAIFHETTNGPFDPSDTVFADWAPSPSTSAPTQIEYLKTILSKVNEISASRKVSNHDE